MALHNKQFEHVKAAAKHFKVDRNTLSEHFKGRKTHTQAHESTQLFSKAEEDALYLQCKHLTVSGVGSSTVIKSPLSIFLLYLLLLQLPVLQYQTNSSPFCKQ
jgi:hypothetical protein